MLGEALEHLKTLPRDADHRADAFEAMAEQIEQNSGGAWRAARGQGTDGSHIFLGRQGEGLVIAPDGKLYRGGLGKGIDIASAGLCPRYTGLKALD
jgi:hypothetical protein